MFDQCTSRAPIYASCVCPASPLIVLALLVLCEEGAFLALCEDVIVRFAFDVRVNDDHQLATCCCQFVLHVHRCSKVVLVPGEVPAPTSEGLRCRPSCSHTPRNYLPCIVSSPGFECHSTDGCGPQPQKTALSSWKPASSIQSQKLQLRHTLTGQSRTGT